MLLVSGRIQKVCGGGGGVSAKMRHVRVVVGGVCTSLSGVCIHFKFKYAILGAHFS